MVMTTLNLFDWWGGWGQIK